MSLQKTITHPTGYDLDFFKVTDVRIQPINRVIDVRVDGWKSKADFDAGKALIYSERFVLSQENISGLAVTGLIPATKEFLNKIEKAATEIIPDLTSATEDETDVI